MRSSPLLVLLLLVAVGCTSASSSKFDGSTEEAGQESLARLTEGMSSEERIDFKMDCLLVALGADTMHGMATMLLNKEPTFKKLDGMTVEQIRARAVELRTEQKQQAAAEAAK